MECSSLTPAMRRVGLTLVDCARATSKPRPATARAAAPAVPAFRKSRRVTAGISALPTARTKKQPDPSSALDQCQLSAGRDQEVGAVVGLRIAEQVQDARVPGHDHAGRAGRLVLAQRLDPGRAVGRNFDRGPYLYMWVRRNAQLVDRLDLDDDPAGCLQF